MAIAVKISDLQIARSPEILVTYGLGSCVAIMLYDPVWRVGGMSHFMLPNSKEMRPRKLEAFADTAVDLLLQKLRQTYGVDTTQLKAKIVGGASMFSEIITDPTMSMGFRNIQAAHTVLQEHQIPIIADDVGGSYGRTVYFLLETGDVRIRYVSRKEIII